jgi:hypothetical protein
MSDALRRRRFTADRTVPVRRRLATLESQLPYSYGEEDERSLPDAATTGKIVGLLFDTLDRDRERFGAFVRARWSEISDEDLEALTDGAAREANAGPAKLEVVRGGRGGPRSWVQGDG